MEPSTPPLRTYGRIRGRTLRAARARLMDERLGAVTVDPAALELPEGREVWLEIGFGGGEHLAGQAALNPDVLFLGAEPFVNGQASLLAHIEERGLTNVRIHGGDARELTAVLPDASVSRVFILFPDPWPKTRHNKRRIVQPEFIVELARVLKPGGRLRFATDWAAYADEALERFLASPDFDWPAERASDWKQPPAEHLTTRYETKKLGDCAPVFLDFIRR
ncbi:MAG: tRNA (guanosine(46)-N7)-methyltransferase TrmB [Caulobacteraceae bacterium]